MANKKQKALLQSSKIIIHVSSSLQINIKLSPFCRLPVWIAPFLHVAKRLRSDCARRKKVYRLLHKKLVGTLVISCKLIKLLLSSIIHKVWPYLLYIDAHNKNNKINKIMFLPISLKCMLLVTWALLSFYNKCDVCIGMGCIDRIDMVQHPSIMPVSHLEDVAGEKNHSKHSAWTALVSPQPGLE